jgi:hypothetical protein
LKQQVVVVQVTYPDIKPEIDVCIEDGPISTKRVAAEGGGEKEGVRTTVAPRKVCQGLLDLR